MKLSFDDLRPHHASFEIKFDHAWLIWDHSGSLWSAVLRKIPGLKIQHAEPSKVIFASTGDRESQLLAESGRIVASEFNPDKKLHQLSEMASVLAGAAVEALELAEFTRVGLRVIFIKEFSSQEESADAVFSTGLIKALQGEKVFGVAKPLTGPEFVLHGEDGKNGFGLGMKAETVEVGFEPSFGLRSFFKPMRQTSYRVSLDIDCYLTGPVMVDQILVPDWISQTFHIMRRDGAKIIEE
jgi:hypothetical protein